MAAETAKMRLAAAVVLLGTLLLPVAAVRAQYMDMMMVLDGIGTRQFYRAAERVSEVNSIRVDRLSTLSGARYGRGRLDRVLEAYPDAIGYLHAQLRANPIAARDIGNQGFGIEDIVYLVVAGDGGTTVYADDLR